MDAENIIQEWEICLNKNDLNAIVGLYLEDAMLWGTFSKVMRGTSELIQEYFQGLFAKQELKVNFSTISSRKYGDTTVFSGTYEFSYREKEMITHAARFTFVVCKDNNGNFKIAEHHSSLVPD